MGWVVVKAGTRHGCAGPDHPRELPERVLTSAQCPVMLSSRLRNESPSAMYMFRMPVLRRRSKSSCSYLRGGGIGSSPPHHHHDHPTYSARSSGSSSKKTS